MGEARCAEGRRYLRLDVGTPVRDSPPAWWAKLLTRVVPPANPDIEALIAKAQVWWLEIDAEGCPQREIGFSERGESIVLAPIGDNVGYLAADYRCFTGQDIDQGLAEAFRARVLQQETLS